MLSTNPLAATDTHSNRKPALNHLKQLDGIRFLAVGLVLFDHWMAERVMLPLGPLGVTIFFVLSGFLIVRILLSSKEKLSHEPNGGLGKYLKTFYIRRTIRIFPIYYITLLVMAALNEPGVREHFGWLALYATNIYIAVNETWIGTSDHLWSLAVEEQVYLFFPLLIFFVPRRFVFHTAVLMIVGSVALRYLLYRLHVSWTVQYVSMPTCLDSFGLGALMAFGWLYHRERFERFFSNRWWLPISIVLFIVMMWYERQLWNGQQHHSIITDVWERLIASLLGFCLIGRAVVGFEGGMKWLLENRVSQYLGQISYGIYLFHNYVYNHYHTPPTHLTVRSWHWLAGQFPVIDGMYAAQFVYFSALTIGLATVSWFLIEKPFNALKDRFSY